MNKEEYTVSKILLYLEQIEKFSGYQGVMDINCKDRSGDLVAYAKELYEGYTRRIKLENAKTQLAYIQMEHLKEQTRLQDIINELQVSTGIKNKDN